MVMVLADFAKSQMNSSPTSDREPFLYKCRNQNGNDIKAYLLEWKQLVKYNKVLIVYASSSLKLNKFDVEAAFMQEYSDLIEKKSTAQLHVVK